MILGFYGLAPNVEIVIANPTVPSSVALVAGFPPVPDANAAYNYSILIRRPDQAVIQRTPVQRLSVSPIGRGLVAFGFVIPTPYAFGTYSIRITVNDDIKLDTSIRVRAATQTELVSMTGGGLAPPPAPGRAN